MIGVIAISPLAFTKASRVEFSVPSIFYGAAVLVVLIIRNASKCRKQEASFSNKVFSSLFPIVLMIFVFTTILGQLRSVESKEYSGKHELFRIAKAPFEVSISLTSYIVSSLYSAGPITAWIDWAEPRLYGRRYFEVVFKLPEKIGMLPVYGEMNVAARADAFSTFGEGNIAFTPGTMAKVLTREVGREMAPLAAFFVMFLTVALTTIPRCYRTGQLVVSVVLVKEAFLTFQTVQGFGMSNVWRIIGAFGIGFLYRRYSRNFSRKHASVATAEYFLAKP